LQIISARGGIKAPSRMSLRPDQDRKPITRAKIQELGPLLLAVWFGLIDGLLEVGLRLSKLFFLGDLMWLSNNLLWMVPLATTILFVAVGLVMCIAGGFSPGLASIRILAMIYAFLAALGLLLAVPPLHGAVKVLLAAGFAVQLSRLISRNGHRFYLFVQHTVIWLICIVVIMGAALQGRKVFGERRAVSRLGPAPTGAPNVLLITLDTVRAESLSLYGHERPTSPHLERLAQAGVRFELAISTAPWTLPSHASMMTGRLPHELSAGWSTPLDERYATLAELLGRRGYATAGFVANLDYCSSTSGLDRGFQHYQDYPISLGQVLNSSELTERIVNNSGLRRYINYHEQLNRKPASELNREFLRWLSGNEKRPFFAFLNYYDAHEPFLPPEPFASMFGGDEERRNPAFTPESNVWPEEQVRIERNAYEGAIAYLDHQIGLLFDELGRRGTLDNTLVIITSDHGEEFSEHGVMGHGYDLFLPTIHVPLLISFPRRIPTNLSVPDAVSLRDIPATIADLLGIEGANFPGISLARHWDRSRKPVDSSINRILSELTFAPGLPDWYPVSKGDMKSIVAGHYHYIKNGDGREELYDFVADAAESNDVAESAEGGVFLNELRESLAAAQSPDRGHRPGQNP
jgi:arylsulfatase A-like enzyme